MLVDAAIDTDWAQAHAPLRKLVHVFHQEWHGIRAAAGYLPGKKIAISFYSPLALSDLERIVQECSDAAAVVFHSWSDNMTLVAHALRETAAGKRPMVAVWHGNTAQFINVVDARQVAELVRLRRAGVLDALCCVKPDFHLLSDRFEKVPLLNVGPRVRAPTGTRSAMSSALIPVPLDWRKNLHTNLFACSAAGLRTVFVTAKLEEKLPIDLRCKVHLVERPSRADLFTLISQVDVVLNASLSECQPMTALEALSHRVPCLTGPLSLGELDEHPYQALAQVGCVDALGPVVRAIKTMAGVPAEELQDMMADYEQKLMREAFARLERLLP